MVYASSKKDVNQFARNLGDADRLSPLNFAKLMNVSNDHTKTEAYLSYDELFLR
jgi:hypothetical protein